jgi:hypothetical protein
MDLTPTLAPKSNQLNSDDLIAGPRTITITSVVAGNAEQPVAVHYQGDQGKPWYPSKGMRRVLVAAWGPDASQYIGRGVTLFRNPEVTYGGIQVGGIQISHLSGLDGPLSIALTMNRQKRTPYKVQPLRAPAPAPLAAAPAPDPAAKALAVCQSAGLTDLGLAAFCDLVSSGTASTLAQLPAETLARIVEFGISPETVAKCNTPAAPSAEPEPAAPAEDLPLAWS